MKKSNKFPTDTKSKTLSVVSSRDENSDDYFTINDNDDNYNDNDDNNDLLISVSSRDSGITSKIMKTTTTKNQREAPPRKTTPIPKTTMMKKKQEQEKIKKDDAIVKKKKENSTTPTAVKQMIRLQMEHDEENLSWAIETDSAMNDIAIWHKLKKQKIDLFANQKVDDMRFRCIQIAAGLTNKIFETNNKDILLVLRNKRGATKK